jgi:hypothetical protein
MKILSVLSLAMCLSSAAFAQQPTTAEINEATKKLKAQQVAKERIATEKALAQKAATDAKVQSTGRVRQPVNIKIEFTLTDQRAGSAPIKRNISLIVSDGGSGMIRSQSEVIAVGGVPLNVDVNPEILADGKVRLGFGLQYDWPAPLEAQGEKNVTRGTVAKTSMNDHVSLILESGKPMVAAQSADPIGDRQVQVEVKATVLK